jgi:hypothetical protein
MWEKIFSIANSFTPMGVVVLLIAFVAYLLLSGRISWRSIDEDEDGKEVTLKTLDEKVNSLTRNHLHEAGETLKRIETAIGLSITENNRNFSELKESISYIKAKLNGKQ